MAYLNKILALFLISILSFGSVFADANKDNLISQITTLQTNLNTLKTNKTKELETAISALTTKYDTIFKDLGYDTKTVNYLVSLGKLTSNFKSDLVNDLTSLKAEINTKVGTELTSLDTIKDNVNYKYTTVTDTDKTKLQESINTINTNYASLGDTLSTKITQLSTKYSTSLETYKTSLKTAYDANKSTIASVKSFDDKFQALYTLKSQFDTNYNVFKEAYLSYAGDLKDFSAAKQTEYVGILRTELEKLRDGNLEANKSLANYKADIDRLIEILLENFKNSLSTKITQNYGVIYSDTDLDSLLSRYENLKNKYYDSDLNVKAQDVLSSSGSSDEVQYVTTKLTEINTNIKNLIGTDTKSSVTISNIKIRLENEMVKYYNDNYQSYREDLLAKLKEKLDLNTLETKNALLAGDSIDLRFSMVNDKIAKSSDLAYIKDQVNTFKSDISKYSYLNNASLNKKIKKLNNNLDIFVIGKELSQSKYTKYSKLSISYDNQVTAILNKIKVAYPNDYETKLTTIITKIDTATSKKISDKSMFILLVVKKSILNWLNNNY